MNLKKAILLFGMLNLGCLFGMSSIDQKALDVILSNKNNRTFLLSYPRSGNTWTRYCIEFLTQRPSFNRFYFKHNINYPLGWLADFPLDINKPPIEKIHVINELKKTGANSEDDALILIVRNPKEALIRHAGKTVLLDAVQKNQIAQNIKTYFEALQIFDEWVCKKKLIIYYEDLMQNPEAVLLEILDFLNESPQMLPGFLHDYQIHKKKCLSLYKASASAGNDLLYHSKSLTREERLAIDNWIETEYPAYWQKYLKARYAESNY